MSGAQDTTQTPVVDPNKEIAEKLYDNSGENKPIENAKPTEEVKPTDTVPPVEPKVEDKPTQEDLKEITLPQDSPLTAEDLEAVKEYAKENGLTNKQAQALIEKQNERLNKFIDKEVNAFQQKVAGYEAQVKSDKEIGGTNFNKSMSLAKRVLERYGNEQLKAELNNTGFGSHPEVIRLLARIGSTISDDSLIAPAPKPVEQTKTLAEQIYGKQ